MLTLVPTPIGNLEDISLKALEAFKLAQVILCEDTRVTKKLLSLLSSRHHLSFSCNQFISFHHHNGYDVLKQLDKRLLSQQHVVYVSDAGMPCVSDPGALLVQYCLDHNISYDVVPGANALLMAFCMSGFDTTSFSFFGFLPSKGQSRAQQLANIMGNSMISILYEAPHRLIKLINEIADYDPHRMVFLAKELTKRYQKVYKNEVQWLCEQLQKENIKGEWVVVIDADVKKGEPLTLADIQSLSLPPKQKAKLISKLTGESTKEVYQQFLDKLA